MLPASLPAGSTHSPCNPALSLVRREAGAVSSHRSGDPGRVTRRTDPRLHGFDYGAPGAYFVTICAFGRGAVFGLVRDGELVPNRLGILVRRHLSELPARFPSLRLDEHIVMPDHVHAVVVLPGAGSMVAARARATATARARARATARARQASPLRLGTVIGSFKAGVSRVAGRRVWQRGYYDHIVRDEEDLDRIREYIATNPARWRPPPSP